MFLNIFNCPLSTSRDFARLRLRFALFFVSRCLRPGRVLLSLPVPVTLNLAMTAFRVFIFGTAYSPFFGRLPVGAIVVDIARPSSLGRASSAAISDTSWQN